MFGSSALHYDFTRVSTCSVDAMHYFFYVANFVPRNIVDRLVVSFCNPIANIMFNAQRWRRPRERSTISTEPHSVVYNVYVKQTSTNRTMEIFTQKLSMNGCVESDLPFILNDARDGIAIDVALRIRICGARHWIQCCTDGCGGDGRIGCCVGLFIMAFA